MKQHFTLNRKLLVVLMLTPFLYYGMNYKTRLERAKQNLAELQAVQTKTKQIKCLVLKSHEEEYAKADPHYIESVLEPFELLKDEKHLLKNLSKDPLLHTTKALLDRLKSLESNQLKFSEISRVRTSEYIDVEIKLMHPVKLNADDLKNLLVLIENVSIQGCESAQKPPFLAVKRALITQKDAKLELDLTLIKREKHENTL